ncbi:MAG: hypothetical protein H6R02_1384, partial [Burkholderiaceae bacterium]|nr:hypothetical protein [Burkholderiaceae bacterium]
MKQAAAMFPLPPRTRPRKAVDPDG